ncbi:MAG: glycine--tRNA ligase subunit beta, partial [Pseudomonadota bacterium]
RNDGSKGQYYYYCYTESGRETNSIIKSIIEQAINNMKWPKSMRWGSESFQWIRPIRQICCIFDGKIVDFSIAGVKSSNKIIGHRFLHKQAITINDPKKYSSLLKESYVIAEFDKRMQIIADGIEEITKKLNLSVIENENLLSEVAGLNEWPVVLHGKFNENFLELPKEILISSMRIHQKYFSLQDENGKIAPYFIFVANIATADNGAKIIAGNEKVLHSRLSDAKFFWDSDKKIKLIDRFDNLDKIIYHKMLGSMKEKSLRIKELAKILSIWIPHANLINVEQAAMLSKIDLTTNIVAEFPDLQGIIGSYYAKNDGYDSDIYYALYEQYLPAQANDLCPKNPISVALSLADKLDALVGLFAVDEKVTGSKDPYGLRRATLGVIRIIIENNLRIPLSLIIEKTLRLYPNRIYKMEISDNKNIAKKIISKAKAVPILSKNKSDEKLTSVTKRQHKIRDNLLAFFLEKLKFFLKSNNTRYDVINAVLNNNITEDDIMLIVMKINAVNNFIITRKGNLLMSAYKRAANIVHIEERKDRISYVGEVNPEIFNHEAEKNLFKAIRIKESFIKKAIKNNDFAEVMQVIYEIKNPLDNFLNEVTINCANDEIRANRLRLLSQLLNFFYIVADFEKIDSEKIT